MHPMMSRPDGVTDCSELTLSNVALVGADRTSAACPLSHQGILDGCCMVRVPIVNNSQLTVGFFERCWDGRYIVTLVFATLSFSLHFSRKSAMSPMSAVSTLYLAPKPVCMQQCQIIYWMISHWHQMRFSISLAVGVRETARQHSAFTSSQL